jgi:hypothetical protein
MSNPFKIKSKRDWKADTVEILNPDAPINRIMIGVDFVEELRKNPDGFTIRTGNGRIQKAHGKTTGYFVAITNNRGFSEAQAAQYASENNETEYTGAWADKQGNVYADASIWVPDKARALALGREWNQQAVYGVKEQKSFSTETGEEIKY